MEVGASGGGLPLRRGLDDDAAASPNADAQVMVVEQTHAHEGGGVGQMGIDTPVQTIPESEGIVDAECDEAPVGKHR